MIELLEPLAASKNPPKVVLHFFANTFPLAYHYAAALERAGVSEYHRRIELTAWGSKVERNTLEYVSASKKEPHLVPVTVFRPRWAFVPLNLAASQIWNELPKAVGAPDAPPSLDEFLVRAKRNGFAQLLIYAELLELGNYLTALVKPRFPDSALLVAQGGESSTLVPAFEVGRSSESLLRLFIYGGSMSSYMKKKKTRYLPLALPETLHEKLDFFTHTYLRCETAEWHERLSKYHTRLYEDAESTKAVEAVEKATKCPPFYTTYRAYNELAWLFQHRSSFSHAWEFAECLRDHHSAPTL